LVNVAAEVQDARLQVALARDSVGFSQMPQRLFRSSIPDGIDEVEVPDLNLLLVIKVQRSPYLHELKHVAEAWPPSLPL
jgi:hypothetical protein